MNVTRQLLRIVKCPPTWRQFCNVVREELTVQTFCDIHVNVPYSVTLKPLDVHKYHNCDLLRIELHGVKSDRQTIKHIQDGNNIKIFASTDEYDQDTICNIQAPVKANLSVSSQGDISTGVFSGSKLILKSTKGSIFVKKFQGDVIDVNTQKGDIILKGAIVASDINAVVEESGSIKAKRMQGLNSLLKTNEGNITVESSYCDNGVFEANLGDLNLQNIHKNSKIILRNGKLNLTGLDGQIEAELYNSGAEVQISRVLGNSRITMSEGGELRLQLSEEVQENTLFEIISNSHTVDPSLKLVPSDNEKTLYLMPTTERYKEFLVHCEDGQVHIENSSWINMLKLNARKD